MSILTSTIRRRMMDHIDAALGVARPARRTAGGALISRLAAASALRLALRWPALSVFLIVSVIAARLLARRPGEIIQGPGPGPRSEGGGGSAAQLVESQGVVAQNLSPRLGGERREPLA